MLLNRRQCLAALGTMAVAGCKLSSNTALAGRAADSVVLPPPDSATGMPLLRNVTPEDFGAAGDGQTNDTDAFARMTAAVNAAGGGTIILRRTTYIVGRQARDPTQPFAYSPLPIMEFDGCKYLTIVGNGARLRCADGLRFGTFDPTTGSATEHSLPFYDIAEIASPYQGMVTVQNCSGKVTISDLELDGNLAGLVVGGCYGDTGRQIPAYGLRLLNNKGAEHVANLYTHHHALDGVLLDRDPNQGGPTLLEKVVSEYNGRQGCSLVGGSNYNFVDCRFNHTGKAGLVSAPAAGIDIEAEVRAIRNLRFSGCEFANNTGVGMLADSGDTESASFTNCRFVGTTAWSAWPRKPHFRFTDCQFAGALVATFGDQDPDRAVQFLRCSFTDDPSASPTGEIYGLLSYAIADLGAGDLNVRFDQCRFDLKNNLVLPWTVSSIFNDCTMSQLSSRQAYPRGTFTGVNRIDGNVDLYGSKVLGTLTVNGKLIPPTG